MTRAPSPGVLASVATTVLSVLVTVWVVWIGGGDALQERYGALAPLLSLLAHTLAEVTPATGQVPWGLANGAIYGVALGSVLSFLAFLGATAIQYALARCVALEVDVAGFRERLPRRLRNLPVEHPAFLIAARWIPVGSFVVSVSAAAFGVRFGRVMCCSAIAAAPAALLLAAAGAGLLGALTSAL